MQTITLEALRRIVVAHQRYAPRRRRASREELLAAISSLGVVQLDSISTVDRAHRLTLASRVGAFDPAEVSNLLREGRIFEYWAHEASLLPIEAYPLLRRRMLELADRHWWGRARTAEGRAVEAAVLARLREEGALPARAFEGRSEGMWGWKPAKRALEHLFAAGEVAVAGREGFQRLYDLPERVIPPEVLAAPVPDEESFLRGLALRAVAARGALTEAGIADHWRLRGGGRALQPTLGALVEEGLLRRVAVDDGGPSVLLHPQSAAGSIPRTAVLLCPFDNLLWDRPFVRRVFGFRHLIEVYKRPHERVYGYYVLPLLHGERLVGRADLKVERPAGILRILRFTPEGRTGRGTAEALERAASRLAASLGLEAVAHG